MFLVKVQGESKWHTFYNRIEDIFISYLPIQMTRIYGRKISDDDLEVQYIPDKQESELCKMHNEKTQSSYFKVTAGKVELWDKRPDLPPELPDKKPGDTDPDDPGKPLEAGDPRLNPRPQPDAKNAQDWTIRKVVSWERNPERGRVTKKKNNYIDTSRLNKNILE